MSIFESFGLSPIGVTDLHVLCIHGVVSVVARVGSTHGVLARAPPSLPPEAPLERGLNQVLVQVNIEGFVLGKGYEVVPPPTCAAVCNRCQMCMYRQRER